MRHEEDDFQLEAPPIGLMDLGTASRSFDVSRQAFHAWSVRPVRVQGTRRLYDLASILENRLQHAGEADRCPDDADRDRLQARVDLLTEQNEAQRIRNEQLRRQYARYDHAEVALRTCMDRAAEIIQTIPAAIFDAAPAAEPARQIVEASVDDAARALRSAILKSTDADTGTTEVYE